MKRVLPLESGLEFELALWLDRRSDVECFVPQPCRIASSEGVRHVPDLLERRLDGTVTVWDARPTERQDAEFLSQAALSENAGNAVGWAYRVFDGLTRVESQNLRWVSGYRRAPSIRSGVRNCMALVRKDGWMRATGIARQCLGIPSAVPIAVPAFPTLAALPIPGAACWNRPPAPNQAVADN